MFGEEVIQRYSFRAGCFGLGLEGIGDAVYLPFHLLTPPCCVVLLSYADLAIQTVLASSGTSSVTRV